VIAKPNGVRVLVRSCANDGDGDVCGAALIEITSPAAGCAATGGASMCAPGLLQPEASEIAAPADKANARSLWKGPGHLTFQHLCQAFA
jgi:hypothetical protein